MTTLTEGYYFDGVALKTFARWIETRDGLDDTPSVRGDNVVLLGRHGQAWRRKKYDVGRKQFVVAVNGVLDEYFTVPATGSAQRVLYERNLDDLLRMLTPRHRLLDVERVLPDGTRRRADCEVINAITPRTLGDTYGQVSFDLVVPDAFWEDVDVTTYRLPYDVAGPDAQAVEVYSLVGQDGYCSDAVVTVTGPCTTVEIRDSETGSGFSYGALTGGQSLIVDAGAFTATKASVSVLTDLTLFDGQLLEMAPAPETYRGPTLDITAPGSTAGFTVTVASRRKWLR